MTAERPRIDIVYFDAGSGHRSSAIGLARALESELAVRARAVDILEVIAGHRLFHATVRAGTGYFNWWLRREQVRDLKGLINLSLLSHDLVSRRGVERIGAYWRDAPPAAVVSVTPMYNPVLSRALHAVRPNAPYIVVPVDFEEGKRRYWFDPTSPIEYVCTAERHREQALALGIPRERLHQASGMIIDPEFYGPPPADRAAALRQLGLDPSAPTGTISFGGQGSVLVEECAAALENVDRPLNVIILCGRDKALRSRIESRATKHSRLVVGFTPEPPVLYHHVADFLIGKPGSMTITEAVVTETPILAIRSRGLSLVQRGNERWVEQTRAGKVVARAADLPAAVAGILADRDFPERLRLVRHDGVFSAARQVGRIAGIGVGVGRSG